MRIAVLFAGCLLLASCASHNQQVNEEVKSFYTTYLSTFSQSQGGYQSAELQRYISSDTLQRLAEVMKIPEQEIVNSDYFTYTQDYDPHWIKELKVGQAKPFMGGQVVDVWLGVGSGKSLHLKTYLRYEKGRWKIYRVRDITDKFEHKLFNAGAINLAKKEATQPL